ncbi:MAG: hypothetical protein JSS75_08505 [Bacteroidetes bacterium]|nr:hypothetical protein [Bacteroidota bacterium]
MLKLQRFIDSLYPDELERVRELIVEGKQNLVLQAALRVYRVKGGSKYEHTQLDSLSTSHRHQISSVLLQRAIRVFAPEGGLPLLRLLARKQLPTIFRGEFRRVESEVLRSKDQHAIQEFYFGASILLHRFARYPHEQALIKRCRERFAVAVKRDRTELLVFEGAELAAELPFLARHTSNPTKTMASIERMISAYSQKVATQRDTRCLYFESLIHAHLHFWRYYDADAYIGSLKRARKLLRTIDIPFVEIEQLRLEFLSADGLMAAGKPAEAFEVYHSLYTRLGAKHELWDEPFFLLRYAELAIVNGKLEQAEQILSEHCVFLPYVLPNYASANIALIRALLLNLQGRPAEVLPYLNEAYGMNSKMKQSMFTDLRIRMVECASFALRGDIQMVDVLCNRAQQFLRSKHLGVSRYNAGKYFLVLRAFVRFAAYGTPVPPELVEAYALYTGGRFGMYGTLLEHVCKTIASATSFD